LLDVELSPEEIAALDELAKHGCGPPR